jgi:signal transduction histidine kinase
MDAAEKSPTFAEALDTARTLIVNAARTDEERRAAAILASHLDRGAFEVAHPAEARQPGFLSALCHDLKDPLAAIVMGATFLRRTMSEGETPARRVVDAIQRSAEKLARLVTDFSDVTRLEARRIEPDVQPVSAAELARTAVDATQAEAGAKKIELAPLAVDAGLRVLADRALVVRAMGKLLDNAVKFTDAGGRVTVNAERSDGEVRFSVTDTGRGIEEARRESIFDREANARQRPREGTGLGLAIVRGLIELHRGMVGFTSEVGRGTTFWFTLPKAD